MTHKQGRREKNFFRNANFITRLYNNGTPTFLSTSLNFKHFFKKDVTHG